MSNLVNRRVLSVVGGHAWTLDLESSECVCELAHRKRFISHESEDFADEFTLLGIRNDRSTLQDVAQWHHLFSVGPFISSGDGDATQAVSLDDSLPLLLGDHAQKVPRRRTQHGGEVDVEVRHRHERPEFLELYGDPAGVLLVSHQAIDAECIDGADLVGRDQADENLGEEVDVLVVVDLGG